MRKLLPLLVLILAAPAFGQTDLPEIGKIADIQGKTKVYLASDAESRKAIIKKLAKQKTLILVDKPSDAEFFLEYRTTNRERVTSLNLPFESGQLDAYFFRNQKKVLAWSESEQGGGWSGDTPGTFANKFLKAYNKRPN